jgi:hypothetical protein
LKVLLLHPNDTPPSPVPSARWDVIVDLGRAPSSTYDKWRSGTGCLLFSLYDFAQEVDDLRLLQRLLQLGTGRMVDRLGIDWWDVLSLELVPQLQQLMLAHRLSKELGASCELYTSRPHPVASALQQLLGIRLTILQTRIHKVVQRACSYRDAFSRLDTAQLAQVLVDKFDNDHSIRRRFTRRGHKSGEPVILLPSAYINVSRVAVSYAEMLPNHQFLLVRTRNNAEVPALPPNVRSTSLAPYFAASDKQEIICLLELWEKLRRHLAGCDEVFTLADGIGSLGQAPALLRWGFALRDAWNQVFKSENVTACLSADDSNPPSSIPLIMAKKRGLPALACHHGALNYHMAIKTNHADVYLVKNDMEQDYLRRICKVASEKTVIAATQSSRRPPLQGFARRSAPWLVFFTEPYHSSGWRSDEVYRDLLPRLCALAKTCGLRLVFKLHPFDNIKGHRKMLRRFVPEYERQIEVLAGPPSHQLWNNTRVALTVQSSTALECTTLGIPVFLCSWLRDPWSGYVQQYVRFGIGHVLESPEQIDGIPALIEMANQESPHPLTARSGIDTDELADLFLGKNSAQAPTSERCLTGQATRKWAESSDSELTPQ